MAVDEERVGVLRLGERVGARDLDVDRPVGEESGEGEPRGGADLATRVGAGPAPDGLTARREGRYQELAIDAVLKAIDAEETSLRANKGHTV